MLTFTFFFFFHHGHYQHTLSENKEQLTAMENAVRETESRAAMSLAVRDLLVRVLEKREKEKQSLAKTLAEKQQFIGYMEKQLGKAAWTFEQRQMRLHKAKVQLDDIGESEQRVYFRKMAEDFSLRVRAEHQYETPPPPLMHKHTYTHTCIHIYTCTSLLRNVALYEYRHYILIECSVSGNSYNSTKLSLYAQ
jgi:hypothetical protein